MTKMDILHKLCKGQKLCIGRTFSGKERLFWRKFEPNISHMHPFKEFEFKGSVNLLTKMEEEGLLRKTRVQWELTLEGIKAYEEN